MKKPFILCCITLLAIAPVCFSQGKPTKAGKPTATESTISDLEKSAWEAYKNKQADAFKALMSKDYYGVYAEGVKTLDAELADMARPICATTRFQTSRWFSRIRRWLL